jgi:hypothetical protein
VVNRESCAKSAIEMHANAKVKMQRFMSCVFWNLEGTACAVDFGRAPGTI